MIILYNLEDGHFSNTLRTYRVTANEDFTCFEPHTPQYKKLKNGEFVSLTLTSTALAKIVETESGQHDVLKFHAKSRFFSKPWHLHHNFGVDAVLDFDKYV